MFTLGQKVLVQREIVKHINSSVSTVVGFEYFSAIIGKIDEQPYDGDTWVTLHHVDSPENIYFSHGFARNKILPRGTYCALAIVEAL